MRSQSGSSSPTTLSVIIPCYNAEKYIGRCLDSLLVDPVVGIEIICVDDGSIDGTREVLKTYIESHPGQVFGIFQENMGAWCARLAGIEQSRGSYISFVDADDEVAPSFTKDLYAKAIEPNADLVVCGFQRVEEGSGKVISREFCSERDSFTLQGDPGRLLEVNPAPWNKAYRAELLKELPELHERPVMFDDLILLLLACLKLKGSIVFLPNCLVNYYVRENSLINSVEIEQIEGAQRALQEVKSLYANSDNASMMEVLSVEAFLHLGISMLFRILDKPNVDIKGEARRIDRYLSASFPEWKKSRYLKLRFALTHGSAMQKLWVASIFYRAGLMPLFLTMYRRLTKLIGRDIKW